MLLQLYRSSKAWLAHVWYADDVGAADTLVSLRRYWDELVEIGPGFGYFPNAIKTLLLTKPERERKNLASFFTPV